MLRRILLLGILLPAAAFAQSFVGSYRVIFVDLGAGNRLVVAEFSVSADGSLSGILRIDNSEKSFRGKVEEDGKFEAVIEQGGDYTYNLRGKFDGDNKIALIHREQTGWGLNKSVSERAVEGQFAKVKAPLPQTGSSVVIDPRAEVGDTGKSLLKVVHSQTLFGTAWTDIIAAARFESAKMRSSGNDAIKDAAKGGAPDLLVVNVRTTVEGQQTLMISIPVSTQGNKVWRQNELRAASYREVKGEQRNLFLTGATFQTDSRYADGKIEIARENESQIVFKLTNFKIKKLNKEEFATLDGFIYAAIPSEAGKF